MDSKRARSMKYSAMYRAWEAKVLGDQVSAPPWWGGSQGASVPCPSPPGLDESLEWPCKHHSLPSLSWPVLSISTEPLTFRQGDPRELQGEEMPKGMCTTKSLGFCTNHPRKQSGEQDIPWQVWGLLLQEVRGPWGGRMFPSSESNTEIRYPCRQTVWRMVMKSWMSAREVTVLACKGGAVPLSSGVWGSSGERTKQTEEVGGFLCGGTDFEQILLFMWPRLPRRNNVGDSVMGPVLSKKLGQTDSWKIGAVP